MSHALGSATTTTGDYDTLGIKFDTKSVISAVDIQRSDKPSDELTSAIKKADSLRNQNSELRENILFLMQRLEISQINWKSQPTTSNEKEQPGVSAELAKVTKKIAELTHENEELFNVNSQLTARWRAECEAEENIKRIVIDRVRAVLEFRVNSQPMRAGGCGGGGGGFN